MSSLTVYVHISCILIQDIASQYPPMYGIQGYSQMVPYQSQIPEPQYYDAPYSNQFSPRFRSRSKKRRGHKHRTMKSCSSSESSSESENDTEGECPCDLTCNQCNPDYIPICCTTLCNECKVGINMNQEILYVPYPYPIVVPTEQPNNEKDKPGNTPTAVSEASDDHSEDPPAELLRKKLKTEQKNNDKKKINKHNDDESVTVSKENKSRQKSSDTLRTTEAQPKKEEPTEKPKETKKTIESNEVDNTVKILLDAQKAPNLPEREFYNDIIFKVPNKGNKNNKYVLTSMRRSKDDWLPKYGIVPIPDRMAADLITNLRSIKTIQPVRETKQISALESPKSNVQTIVVGEPKTSHEHSLTHGAPHNKVQTILVRDSGTGLTIEGPRNAIQNFNRRLLNNILSDDQLHNLTDKEKSADLPLELVKKIYKY